MAQNTFLEDENKRFKKINEKLLYLLNKYRYAYLKSLELIIFYEEIIRNNSENNEDKDIFDSYRKKRQHEHFFEEELLLRKRFKNNLFNNKISIDIVPYKNRTDIEREKDKINKIEINNIDREKDNNCIAPFFNDNFNEKNKSDYINLGALDFSAYKEDSEGYIKYYEKEKRKINTDKISKEDITNASKSVYNYESRRKPLFNQSIYMKHSNIKNSQITALPSTSKSIYIDKYSKTNNTKKMNILNKSVYQNTLNKQSGKNEIKKSIFASSNKPSSNLTKSIYSNSKNVYNKHANMNEDLFSRNKSTLINKIKNNGNITNKKMNINKSNNLQNSIYIRKLNTSNISNHSVYMNKNTLNKSLYRSNTLINNKKKDIMENGMENRNCAINMKYKIDENNNKNVNENIQSYNISYINKNKKETTNSSMEEQTNREIKKEEYMEFSTKNLSEINLYDPITLKNVEDLIENDSKIKNSEVEIKSSIIIELKNREDLSGILHTNEEKKSTIDLYFKEKDQFSELKNNLSDIYSHIKKEKILVDNSQDELKSDENRSEEKIYERSIDKSNDSTNNLINKEDITCDDRTETYKLGNIKMKKELLDDIDKQSNKPFMEFSVIKNGDRNEYSLNNEDSKEIFDDMEKKDRKSKTKNYGEKEGSVEENSHLLKNEKEKESYKVINTLNILQNNKNCNVVNSTKKNTVNNDHDMNNENLILKNKIDVHLNIEEENNKNNIIVMNENEKNTQANIDMNDNNDNAKSCNRKIPVNFKNIILKINDEIKNKINETKENDNLITNKITSKQSILKKFPFPPSLRKNLLVSSEKEEVKNINNNRANLFIEMNFSSDYITLDAVDLDNVVNEGIHNYKKVEESYIESGQYIKDIVIYTDIMRKEEKTLYFCDLNDREEGINEKNNIIIFKTSDQIKNEITKSIGISIFHCINNTIHPSKSLVNDEKLEMWFTKKKREKNDNRSFMESDSSQSLIFKKSKRRLSTMGSFCQPIIIMLSSLKRQSTYNNLKKIITSLILCTCDSASLEKILHTLPEENSKNYLLWKDAINKLYIYIGEKKNEIIKKFLEVKEEDSDENNEDDTCEINEKNKYENFNLKTYDFMRGIGNYNNCLNTSFSSTNTTTYSTSKQKNNVDDSHIYEDEEFCLFICTIKNVHKRLRYLLLIDNFDFIYEDLLKHIKNKLNSIELIMNKHVLLKQLFCNILYLCNWLNEPKMYKWFQWNDVVKQLEKLYGYSDNGKISRERCIMLLLAEHTGEIFTEKELNNLKKISKFHIKDLYDKSIDFINSYLELKNQMNNEEFKQSCCISTDEKSIFSEDKFLEKIKTFVEKNYNKMLFIMWNIVLLINQYLILIIWLGDVRPFYPLFSYIDENRKMKYSHDLFINIILFFESYNKYINIIKKRKETNINEKNVLLKNTDDCYLPPNSFSIKGEKPILSKKNNLNNNFYNYTDSNIINKNKNEKRTYEDKEIKNISKVISRETKKRKSLTNTVDYACEIKRKSLEKENKNFIKKKSLENTCEVEFELSD